MAKLRGILCPTVTFFDRTGALDVPSFRRHLGSLIAGDIHGLVPLGSMGEFPLLNADERRRLAEAAVEEAGGRVKVVVGTGGTVLEEVIGLSKHAADIGADAVLVVTPYFLRPNDEGLRRFYQAVRSSLELPVLAYNIPPFTGFSIGEGLAIELAEEGVIQGMKDSQGDLGRDLRILARAPRDFSLLTGADALLTPFVTHGGHGGVLGSSNLFPRRVVEAYQEASRGNLERAVELQTGISSLASAMNTGPFPAAAKYMVEKVWGLPSGLRPPVAPLSGEERARVDSLLSPYLGKWS